MLKIGVLTVLTVGAFAYLIHSLDRSAGTRPGEVTAEGRDGASAADAGGRPPHGNVSGQGAVATPDPSLTAGKGASDSPAGIEHSSAGRVKLSFIGDVMFADNVNDLLQARGFDYPFKYVKQYLEKADITAANLETPITVKGTAQSKEYVYRSSPNVLPELKKAGIDLVNVANNHSMDYGQDGLVDTLSHLDEQSILRVGAGRDTEEAYRPVIVDHNGVKVAFLGFSRVVPEPGWYAGKAKPGVAGTYSAKLPLEAIAKARAQADLVVVIAHWGEERKDRPNKIQTDLAHQYIDEGADLVVASHPHELQGFEEYKGKWIAYSLGNFIFTTNNHPPSWESMILEASCSKERTCDLSLVPIVTKWAQPIRMVEEDGLKLFDRLTKLSVNAKVDGEGKVTPGPVNVLQPEPVKPPAESAKQTEPKKATEPPKPAPEALKSPGTGTGSDSTKPAAPKPGSSSKPSDSSKPTDDRKPSEQHQARTAPNQMAPVIR